MPDTASIIISYVPNRYIGFASGGRSYASSLRVQPEMTDAQVEQLRDNLAWITEHPDRHDQHTWMAIPYDMAEHRDDEESDAAPWQRPAELGTTGNCGAFACLAGWVVLRDPSIPLVRTGNGDISPADLDDEDGTWDTGWAGDTGEVARHVLGLHRGNATALFAGSNELGDLWRMASIITAGRIAVPAQFVRSAVGS